MWLPRELVEHCLRGRQKGEGRGCGLGVVGSTQSSRPSSCLHLAGRLLCSGGVGRGAFSYAARQSLVLCFRSVLCLLKPCCDGGWWGLLLPFPVLLLPQDPQHPDVCLQLQQLCARTES